LAQALSGEWTQALKQMLGMIIGSRGMVQFGRLLAQRETHLN
jgi:hypothetical protein